MLRRFFRNDDGAAAVEFGLIAPLMVAVLVTTGAMGGLVLAYNKMRQAVSSGGQYAMTVAPDDTTAVRDVVLAAWDDKPDSGAVSVVKACLCAGVAHSCTTNCDDGDYPEKFTTITATMNYASLGGGTQALTATQKIRTW
jgi:Flp pilus assembly protein TadG